MIKRWLLFEKIYGSELIILEVEPALTSIEKTWKSLNVIYGDLWKQEIYRKNRKTNGDIQVLEKP